MPQGDLFSIIKVIFDTKKRSKSYKNDVYNSKILNSETE